MLCIRPSEFIHFTSGSLYLYGLMWMHTYLEKYKDVDGKDIATLV